VRVHRQESERARTAHGRAPSVHLQLLIDVGGVLLDGLGRDAEPLRDLLVGEPRSEETEHLRLAPRKLVRRHLWVWWAVSGSICGWRGTGNGLEDSTRVGGYGALGGKALQQLGQA